jgi:putative acetyltransferase
MAASAVHIRRERPGAEGAIARVNEAAFGGPDEARIVAAVRQAGQAAVSLVAVDRASRVVGHILFTPVAFDAPGAPRLMGLGPMAVWPDAQRQGIGSALVEAGLRECERAGCQAVVVIGHPEYYPRFGFRPARACGLRTEYDVPDQAFMVAELDAGALAGREGLVRYLPEFGT